MLVERWKTTEHDFIAFIMLMFDVLVSQFEHDQCSMHLEKGKGKHDEKALTFSKCCRSSVARVWRTLEVETSPEPPMVPPIKSNFCAFGIVDGHHFTHKHTGLTVPWEVMSNSANSSKLPVHSFTNPSAPPLTMRPPVVVV